MERETRILVLVWLFVAWAALAEAGSARPDGRCFSDADCYLGKCVQLGHRRATFCCVPTTCATAGASCGVISDGCGGTLDCGPCAVCGNEIREPGEECDCASGTYCAPGPYQSDPYDDAGCGVGNMCVGCRCVVAPPCGPGSSVTAANVCTDYYGPTGDNCFQGSTCMLAGDGTCQCTCAAFGAFCGLQTACCSGAPCESGRCLR